MGRISSLSKAPLMLTPLFITLNFQGGVTTKKGEEIRVVKEWKGRALPLVDIKKAASGVVFKRPAHLGPQRVGVDVEADLQHAA